MKGILALFCLLPYNLFAELNIIIGDYMRLPASVQEIASVIGTDKALFLVGKLPRCYSKKSTHVILYVPKAVNLKPDHRLVQILGWPDAVKLCKAFGGEILQPATCADLYRGFRNTSIRRLVNDEGMKPREVAAMFEMSERQISNILKEKPQEGHSAANDNYPATGQINFRGAKF